MGKLKKLLKFRRVEIAVLGWVPLFPKLKGLLLWWRWTHHWLWYPPVFWCRTPVILLHHHPFKWPFSLHLSKIEETLQVGQELEQFRRWWFAVTIDCLKRNLTGRELQKLGVLFMYLYTKILTNFKEGGTWGGDVCGQFWTIPGLTTCCSSFNYR